MAKSGQLIQYIRPDGEFIDLNSPPTRIVSSMSGWGYPPVITQNISGPYQHGTTVLGYRFQPRKLDINMAFTGISRHDWFNERTKLIERMGLQSTGPNNAQLGKLRWEYIQDSTYIQRDIDCYLNRGLLYSANPQWYDWGVVEQLEFIAPDPTIYDPTQVTVTLDTFTDQLILPMTFPFWLGGGEGTSAITYTGSWLSYPVIEIDGPTNGFQIVNESTGISLVLDYFISSGITVTIDLTPNYRTVTDSLGNNLLAYVRDSNLAEFAIEIDPFATDGINTMTVYVVEYTAATEVRIKYYTRYIGI